MENSNVSVDSNKGANEGTAKDAIATVPTDRERIEAMANEVKARATDEMVGIVLAADDSDVLETGTAMETARYVESIHGTGRITMGDVRKEATRAKKTALRTATHIAMAARFGVDFADRMVEIEALRKAQRERVNARLGKAPKGKAKGKA